MKTNFYGIIDEVEFQKLSEHQKEQILLDKHLLTAYCSAKNENNSLSFSFALEISKENLEYSFKFELLQCIYNFLIDHYKRVGANEVIFNQNFDDETFGLSFEQKKVIALIYFNQFFKSVQSGTSIGLDSDNEIIGAEKRFKTLLMIRRNYINELQDERTLVLNYLFGNIEYFEDELHKSNKLIADIFRFENHLSILLSLNNRFEFEEENYFTPKSIAQQIYEKYEMYFDSLKQLNFIEKQLSNQKKIKRAFLVSLFCFFSKKLEIDFPTGRIFTNIINEYYNLNIGEISNPDSPSKKNEIRVKQFQNDWKYF